MAYIDREQICENCNNKNYCEKEKCPVYKVSAADVVPKSEEGAECPTCHGTGRIGTTDWLTKNMTEKQIAEEKAKAIAEHEQYIKTEYARKIFEEIDRYVIRGISVNGEHLTLFNGKNYAEFKKKYIGEKGDAK